MGEREVAGQSLNENGEREITSRANHEMGEREAAEQSLNENREREIPVERTMKWGRGK